MNRVLGALIVVLTLLSVQNPALRAVYAARGAVGGIYLYAGIRILIGMALILGHGRHITVPLRLGALAMVLISVAAPPPLRWVGSLAFFVIAGAAYVLMRPGSGGRSARAVADLFEWGGRPATALALCFGEQQPTRRSSLIGCCSSDATAQPSAEASAAMQTGILALALLQFLSGMGYTTLLALRAGAFMLTPYLIALHDALAVQPAMPFIVTAAIQILCAIGLCVPAIRLRTLRIVCMASLFGAWFSYQHGATAFVLAKLLWAVAAGWLLLAMMAAGGRARAR